MKKASALIFAILVMGLVGIVSLGVSRLSITQIKNSEAITSSNVAYFAAQAGLEHALLKYRYDKDYETYQPSGLFKRYFIGYTGSGSAVLNDKTAQSIDPYFALDVSYYSGPITTNSEYLNIMYDLKIQYQKDYIGCDDDTTLQGWLDVMTIYDMAVSGYPKCANPNGGAGYHSPNFSASKLLKLEENEMSVGFNIEDGSNKDVYVYWKFNGADGSQGVPDANAGMQIEIRGNDASGIPQTATVYYSETGGMSPGKWPSPDGQYIYSKSNAISAFTGASAWTNRKIYLRPWKTSGKITYFGIQPKTGAVFTGNKIGGPITQVESIGYYRGVKRKLWAEIDRKTGELSGSFDFVVSGQNISN